MKTYPPLPKIGLHPLSIDLVRQFHLTFDHPVAKELTVGDAALRRLRVLLIAQELAEFAAAAGVPLEIEVKPALGRPGTDQKDLNGMRMRTWVGPKELCYSDAFVDTVEMADALGDLDYVVQGGNLVFGFPGGLIMEEIHWSNMTKLGADGQPIRDADGKVVKGPNYQEPDIKGVLETFDPTKEL